MPSLPKNQEKGKICPSRSLTSAFNLNFQAYFSSCCFPPKIFKHDFIMQIVMIKYLIIWIIAVSGKASPEDQVLSIYPIEHLKALFTTHMLLEFLSANKTKPLHDFPSHNVLATIQGNRNCIYCQKQFKNSSYLALHYAVKHLDQLYEIFGDEQTVNIQIIFDQHSSIPQQERYQFCMQWFEKSLTEISKKVTKNGEIDLKHFQYPLRSNGTDFCTIVIKKLHEKELWYRLAQICGIALAVIGVMGYILYLAEVNKRDSRRQRQKYQ